MMDKINGRDLEFIRNELKKIEKRQYMFNVGLNVALVIAMVYVAFHVFWMHHN